MLFWTHWYCVIFFHILRVDFWRCWHDNCLMLVLPWLRRSHIPTVWTWFRESLEHSSEKRKSVLSLTVSLKLENWAERYRDRRRFGRRTCDTGCSMIKCFKTLLLFFRPSNRSPPLSLLQFRMGWKLTLFFPPPPWRNFKIIWFLSGLQPS